MRHMCVTVALLQLWAWPAFAEAQTPEWTVEVDHVIGSFNDEQTAFEYVAQALIGPGGEVFVIDADASRVAVFDSTGAFLRDFGREGAGPAEFRKMVIAGFSADTLWVFDAPRAKIVRFDPAGDFVRSEIVDDPDGPVLPLSVSPAHLLGVGATSFVDDSAKVVVVNDTSVATLMSVHRPAARLRIEVADVHGTASHEFHDGELVVASPDGNVVYAIERPFAQRPSTGEFRVTRFSRRGERLWKRSYRYDPLPVAEYHLKSIVDDMTWRFTQLPMLRGREAAVRNAVVEALPVPEYAPAVWSAVAANDGSLWLERIRAEGAWRWIVLDANGGVVGRAALGPGIELSSVDGSRACGIDLAGAGFPRVICYRIFRNR